MNVIKANQDKRQRQIKSIKESITKAIYQGKELDWDTLVLSIRSQQNLSDRTAKDYLKLALFDLGIKKEELFTINKNGN